jgi:hypothetical protein
MAKIKSVANTDLTKPFFSVQSDAFQDVYEALLAVIKKQSILSGQIFKALVMSKTRAGFCFGSERSLVSVHRNTMTNINFCENLNRERKRKRMRPLVEKHIMYVGIHTCTAISYIN